MTVRILEGDCREILPTLPAESTHCVVTSPPYWMLRDYGVEGGIGMEPTLDEHIEALAGVFREVRRVLRKEGTCWVNCGDAYVGGRRGGSGGDSKQKTNVGSLLGPSPVPRRLKSKDLMMMPARIALALQADGWWVRSEIVWHKPNPMPESVRDRPTSAHEKIFLLTKSARYFYDAEAVRIPVTGGAHARRKDGEHKPAKGADPNNRRVGTWKERPMKMPDGWDTAEGSHGRFHRNGSERGKTDKQRGHGRRHAGFNERWDAMTKAGQQAAGANLRNVWTIAAYPFPGAHFATFPPALVEPCIKAGCPAGGTVLDPFGGAGTVGLVADRLDRDAILIELNPEYADMARRRIKGDAPLFAEVV